MSLVCGIALVVPYDATARFGEICITPFIARKSLEGAKLDFVALLARWRADGRGMQVIPTVTHHCI